MRTAIGGLPRLAAALAAVVVVHLAGAGAAWPAAPQLLHTPGYQSPVRGDPGDLLLIAGSGFQPSDRVVYAAVQGAQSAAHPASVPATSTPTLGTAPIVLVGTPPYAITVQLPATLLRGRSYALWVVTAANEWSSPAWINDPRPQWLTPAYVYETADLADMGRTLRLIGRNLSTEAGRATQIRLQGPATYDLAVTSTTGTGTTTAGTASGGLDVIGRYVAQARLPERLIVGDYAVSVLRTDAGWVDLPGQRLHVRPDPPGGPVFQLGDPAWGSCRPNDDGDDSGCFARALAAAVQAGGGTLVIPPGRWQLSATGAAGATVDGFVLPAGINLRGSGKASSIIVRGDPLDPKRFVALFSLAGRNSVTDLTLAETVQFQSAAQARPMIRLGPLAGAAAATSPRIADVVISDVNFDHVGRAITDDAARPLARLFITHDDFAAYFEAVNLPGGGAAPGEPFRIDDSVVRWNRFVPGSYIDVTADQGTIASEWGAAHRVDFSQNTADGSSDEGLQNPDDPKGFRAAFFWNMNNNLEDLLISQNHILCSGDKDGDGEAISLDGSGNLMGFAGAPAVAAAGEDWVEVR
ncbi:MAG TPA: hypothetical protein VMB48_07385, partial [Steroidobacteraceae bacterium]|nr:hypothetical protein [Steroidobacteraceae bacterium]